MDLQPTFPRYMRSIVRGNIEGLIELYEYVGAQTGVGVEVGCHWGESSEVAAHLVGTLHCVDPWEPGFGEDAEEIFDARMAIFNNVTKIKATSVVVATRFADESLDVVYIDAMHDMENVMADIHVWFPKIKYGGYICGHDYDDMETHVGVVKAVDSLLGRPEKRFSDSSWLFQKTEQLNETLHARRR